MYTSYSSTPALPCAAQDAAVVRRFPIGEDADMLKHPVFPQLTLHSDGELSQLLGVNVEERETIHAWPLSCVQSVRLKDGTRLAYKAQLPPTVEPEFYTAASSPLLPRHRLLDDMAETRPMVIDWIDAPSLGAAVSPDREEFVEHGREVVSRIGHIRGDLPVHLSIGSVDAWFTVVEDVLDQWDTLVLGDRFSHTGRAGILPVRAWAASAPVLSAVTDGPRVIHGDLKSDQIFVTTDGYRVIDWQRPVVAPPEVDLVSLLVAAGLDPRRHVSDAVVEIFWFLRLHWAVEAQHTLFPTTDVSLFDRWAAESVANILQ
ncbi:phosphotransferase family protein [Streptomyces sp. NPDC050164]|uniref:phosphotransferase family protein n=1 Tax=Streptomyces sp. NPDC050164 TaxID=3365605 RepID=UPI00379EC043